MTGVMLDKGVLPGAIEFASEPTKPNKFGTPGAAAKSSISLLSKIPVPAATTPAPKPPFTVNVKLTTLRSLSTTVRWVVSGDSHRRRFKVSASTAFTSLEDRAFDIWICDRLNLA